MNSWNKFQQELLIQVKRSFNKPLPIEIEQAFLETPRHLFIKKYYQFNGVDFESLEITEDNLEQKLSILYQDTPLPLIIDSEIKIQSTISQPSLVLMMMEKLQIEKGHKILEIGAASGWNAAMMGKLVGMNGHVYSIEIIPELVKRAQETISTQKITNVSIIQGDGGFGYEKESPFDRIIFTVGAYDIPSVFYDQIKDGGLLLMVLKNKGGGDNLFLFKKVSDHFESIDSLMCGFVPLTGKYQMEEFEPVQIESIPFWPEIKDNIVSKQPFWWGSKTQNNQSSLWKTIGISSFLAIVEPCFEVFKLAPENKNPQQHLYFGLVDPQNKSLAIFKDDLLIGYGNDKAMEKLKNNLRLWLELGMPGASCFELKVYPMEARLKPGKNQWLIKRNDSQFLWTLKDSVN